jgi:hypothetical protein
MSNAETLPVTIDQEAAQELPIARRAMTDADLIVIDCAEMYTIADAMLTDAHDRIKLVTAKFAESVTKAKAAYDTVRNLRDSVLEPYENTKETLRRKMGDWKSKERIEQTRAALEAERARQVEIEQAEKALVDTEKRIISEGGDYAEIERAEADVAIAHVATNELAVPTARGKAGAANDYDIEFTDFPAFLEALAADLRKETPRFDNTLTPAEVKVSQLKDYAKATKGKAFPGVTFKPKISIRARS